MEKQSPKKRLSRNPWSFITMSWLNPILEKGKHRPLVAEVHQYNVGFI
jgi:hypothetical protein